MPCGICLQLEKAIALISEGLEGPGNSIYLSVHKGLDSTYKYSILAISGPWLCHNRCGKVKNSNFPGLLKLLQSKHTHTHTHTHTNIMNI